MTMKATSGTGECTYRYEIGEVRWMTDWIWIQTAVPV